MIDINDVIIAINRPKLAFATDLYSASDVPLIVNFIN